MDVTKLYHFPNDTNLNVHLYSVSMAVVVPCYILWLHVTFECFVSFVKTSLQGIVADDSCLALNLSEIL